MNTHTWSLLLCFAFFLMNCDHTKNNQPTKVKAAERYQIIFTEYSRNEANYPEFNSAKAINRTADIENEYFRNYKKGISKYYGTEWRKCVGDDSMLRDENNLYKQYINELKVKADSMHCTVYAVEALKAGMGDSFFELDKQHKKIWGDREYAGWSIGYLLVKNWNWKAYLIIDPASQEYDHCLKAFRKDKVYPVWKQPDIPIKDMFITGYDNDRLKALLNENEFGWGFSHQGIHTWITHFEDLKECNWLGAPTKKYELFPKTLILKNQFF